MEILVLVFAALVGISENTGTELDNRIAEKTQKIIKLEHRLAQGTVGATQPGPQSKLNKIARFEKKIARKKARLTELKNSK